MPFWLESSLTVVWLQRETFMIMKRASYVASPLLLLLAAGSAAALETEEETGKAPAVVAPFVLSASDGSKVALLDTTLSPRATVILLTSVDCPIAKLYAPRAARLEKEYREEGVRFLGLNPNIQDSPGEIEKQKKGAGIEFPILLDPLQVVTDRLQVTRTTEVLVLDEKLCIRYRGALDDQYGVGTRKPSPTNEYMVEAIEAVLAAEEPQTPATEAPGCLVGRVADRAKVDVTWNEHVAAVVHQECVECHRPGQVGPMSLLSYQDAKGWAPMMAEVVEQGRMPPWHADPHYGSFTNVRVLTDTQKALLVRWAEQGALEGKAQAPAPTPPAFDEAGWAIGEPDLIIQLEEEEKIPAEGVVDYRYIMVDPHLEEDRWVQASEIRPTNPAVTHHVLALLVPPGQSGREALRGPENNDFVESGYFSVNVPGARPNIYPDGMAKRLLKGSKFLFQLHYTPNGTSTTDRTRMGFRFATDKIEHEVLTRGIYNGRLHIPPHHPAAEFEARHEFLSPVKLISMFPHMHMRGKSFRFELKGDEREAIVLDVPRYDFNWQNFYLLNEPLRIEAGESLLCTAVYDNSKDNPFNPNPEQIVRWGDQTFEEMLIGYIDYIAAD